MRTAKTILILFLSAASLVFVNCTDNSTKSEAKSVDTTKIKSEAATSLVEEKKGINEGTPLDNYINTFLTHNPSLFNNMVTFDKASKEFYKGFEEELKKGVLDNMPFKCLTVAEDVISKKPIARFMFTVIDKDSLSNLHLSCPLSA